MILAALVLDAVDGSLLEQFTDVDTGPDGPYQSFDKALDIYYLAIAYLSTMRNWTSDAAFRVAQFLFYYRLVGVLAFELTDARAMLLIFPNTFEYFFIAYEVLRLRFDPARWSGTLLAARRRRSVDLRQAPAGVLDPHRATRLHRHRGRPPVVRRAVRGRACSALRRRARSSCARACPRPTGAGGSPPTRCRRRSPTRTRGTPTAGRRAWGELAEKACAARR